MTLWDLYEFIASMTLPLVLVFVCIIIRAYGDACRLLNFYRPDAYAEFRKPKHQRGEYPPLHPTEPVRTPFKVQRRKRKGER